MPRGQESATILEEGGQCPTHVGGAGAGTSRGKRVLTTGTTNGGNTAEPSPSQELQGESVWNKEALELRAGVKAASAVNCIKLSIRPVIIF